jgi:hypothetical protein
MEHRIPNKASKLKNASEWAFLLAVYASPFILVTFAASAAVTMEDVRTINEELPLGSVTYSGGWFHVTYIEDGQFRTGLFSSCSVGDQDALVNAETVRGCWVGNLFTWESDSLTLTNETLTKVGAIQ